MANFNPWVEPTKAGNFIVRYRDKNGKKLTVPGIQPISKWDRATIEGKVYVGKQLASLYRDKAVENYHKKNLGEVDLSLKLQELYENFMDERDANGLAINTQINTRARLNAFFADTPCVLLSDLTRKAITDWKIAMFKAGYANNTIVARLQGLNTFIGWLKDSGHIKQNPFKEHVQGSKRKGSRIIPEATDPEPRFYSAEEYVALQEALTSSPEMQLGCELAYAAGLRKVELVGDGKDRDRVRGDDILWLADGNARIHLRKEIVKGQKRDRTIPLNKKLILMLGSRRAGPLLSMTRDSFDYRFSQAREKAGINEDLTIHGLRHSFAKNYLQSGQGNMKSLMDLLGHVDPKTTRIYAQFEQSYYHEGVDAAYERRLIEEATIRKSRIVLKVADGQMTGNFHENVIHPDTIRGGENI